MVSIIILTYNALEYTQLCVQSILKNTNVPYELIFVDNGSTDGTVEFLKTLKNVTIIQNTTNQGFAKGNNQGIEVAKGEYILFLNNDVIVTPYWLENMLKVFNLSNDIGLVGPRTNKISGPQKLTVDYDENNINEIEKFANEYRIKFANTYFELPRLVAFCLLVKREVIDKIGKFDENFKIGNFEDDDFCLRASLAGYKLFVANDVFVHHFKSKTFNKNKLNYYINFMQNRQRFYNKWKSKGIDLNKYGYSYTFQAVQQILPTNIQRLLDIGCITGDFGQQLREKYNIEVTGVEINPHFANIASNYLNKAICGDIEKLNLDSIFTQDYFDCVTFIEIFEHLKDPFNLLIKLNKYIKTQGYLVIIVPNLLYFETLRTLLEDNWEYKDYGVANREHLHFFTIKDIEEYLLKAGYYIKQVYVNDEPLIQENLQNFFNELASIGLTKLLDAAHVYEYVIVAQKMHPPLVKSINNFNKSYLIPNINKQVVNFYNILTGELNFYQKRVLEIGSFFSNVLKNLKISELVKLELESLESFNFPLNYFDFIIIDKIEHIYNFEEFINNIKKYLKPYGYILFNFVNFRNYPLIYALLTGSGIYEANTPINLDNIRLYTLKNIKIILHNNDLNIVSLGGTKLDFINDNINPIFSQFIDICKKYNLNIDTLPEDSLYMFYTVVVQKNLINHKAKVMDYSVRGNDREGKCHSHFPLYHSSLPFGHSYSPFCHSCESRNPNNLIIYQYTDISNQIRYFYNEEFTILPCLIKNKVSLLKNSNYESVINIEYSELKNFNGLEGANLNICITDEIISVENLPQNIDDIWILDTSQIRDQNIKNNIFVFPLCIDLELFLSNELNILEKNKYNYLTFWDKDIMTLVNAYLEEFKDNKDVSLTIYLDSQITKEEVINLLSQYIKPNSPDIIILEERLLYKDLLSLFRASNCFITINQSLKSSLFYSLLAMSVGLPVISNKNIELFKNLMFFYSKDSIELKQYLRKCLDTNNIFIENINYIKNNNTPEVVIDKMINRLKNLFL